MKTKKRFLSILLSLALVLGLMPGVSLTAYAADTTVTWNASDIVTVNPWDKSFTKDGITFAPGHADFLDKNFTNGGTFTTASGKFTKIEVTAPYVDISGTGWSGGTWTGDASSSVSYSGDIYDVGMGQLKIVFTIAPDAVAVTGVSLNKESTTLTVGGTETLTATVAPDNATDKTVTWTSSNTSVATVSNAGLVTAVAAGTATITVTATNGTADDTSDDKTATCAVTVNKADPTAPTGLTATYGQTLADVALPEGWSWADSTQSVGNVGDHTFKANFAGNDNYNATSNVDVTVSVGKADPTATAPAQADPITITWTASAITGYRSNPITIEGVTLTAGNIQDWNMPMIKGGGTFTTTLGNFTKIELNADWITDFSGTGWEKNGWQSQTWTGDAASVSYSGTIGGGGMTCDGGSMTITFTIAPAKQAQTITASDVTATYGDTGVKINASTTGDGGLSYAVRSGDTVTVDASGNLTINKAGSAVITVTAAETDTYAQATKDVNVTISTKAMTVSAEDVNATVDGQPHGITVTVTDPASGATVKYGTEAGSYTLDASPTQTEVGEKTVYYQVTSDNYTTYTGSAKVTVSAKQPQTITAENVTANYGDTGKSIEASTSGDGTLSYAVKSGDAVTVNETTGALTIVKAGSAVITVTASETATYAQATKEVTVTINKANAVPATVTANNRTYDGTEKPLVTVTGTPTGGEMQYALGTATEATEQYTTSIPTATEAGTYHVWYKVDGDANHWNVEGDQVTVTISPVNKDALNDAIKAAEAYYDEIKGNADYAVIAETLKKAIDAAKALSGNDNVTEDQVSAALSSVSEAEKTAKVAEKQAVDEAAAKAVTDAIKALSDSAGTGDKDAVAKARAAFEALTEDQKKLVPAEELNKLTAAEASVKAAEEAADKQAKDEAAAKAVTDAIQALSDSAGTSDKDAVAKARAAYDALTEDQKKLVPAEVLNKLTTAEASVKAAEEAAAKQAADEAAAKAVTDAIQALGDNVGLDDKDAVAAARAAYDALTEDQKKLIPEDVLARLTTAEQQVREAEEATDLVDIAGCKITVKSQIYTGKALKPDVTVKFGKTKLKKGTDYSVTYKNNVKIGRATVTVKGKGKYAGSKKATFRINPKGTAFTKLTGGNRQITLKWKNPKNVTGYQLQYSLKKDLSIRQTVTIKKAKTLTATFKKLAANKTYYVRIRTYTTVNKKNYRSAWSKVKTVKTKAAKASNGPDGQDVEIAAEDEMTLTLDEELDGEILLDEIDVLPEEISEDGIVLTLAE